VKKSGSTFSPGPNLNQPWTLSKGDIFNRYNDFLTETTPDNDIRYNNKEWGELLYGRKDYFFLFPCIVRIWTSRMLGGNMSFLIVKY